MNESQETVGTFVIARSDTAKFLELQEECLHRDSPKFCVNLLGGVE